MPSPLFVEIEAAQGDWQWRGLKENRRPSSIQASCLQPMLLVLGPSSHQLALVSAFT